MRRYPADQLICENAKLDRTYSWLENTQFTASFAPIFGISVAQS
jgi:hypothetical protein